MNPSAARQLGWAVALSLGGAVACAALALFVIQGKFGSDLGTTLALAVLYALPLMAVQAATEQALRRKADALQFPLDWIVYGGAKLILGLIAALMGSGLALLLGVVRSWQDLYMPNRMVIVVSVIVACMIRLFSTTRTRLEERNRQLEERVETEARSLRRHEQDLESAREIQQALMPKQLPQIPGFQLAGGYEPARIVAGDYYDAIRLSDSRLVIAIGDVSGKGMAAALLMSNLQAIVRAFAPGGPSPVELCTKANQLIAANVAPGKYITFFYAVVDAAGMRLEYCNAGHNPPLLQRLDGTLETLVEGGPVLGIFPGAGYSFGVVELKHGDRLLVFTDGITEAMNAADEEFGEGRLRDVFAQRFESAGQCYRQVMTEVTRFTGGTFSDDATLMVMTVN